MQVYRIAEMNIGIEPRYDFTREYLNGYEADGEAEFQVAATDKMLEEERRLAEEPVREELYEVTAILRVICDEILSRNGFFLHCSCFEFDGRAVVLTAPSGTGKSTHARLWREHFGGRVVMINDDKPLVREKDGAFFIYGTPWNGKHGISNNISAPVGAVFFLEQAKENSVEAVTPFEALALLLKQTVFPSDKNALSALVDMLSRLIERTPMYRLRCDISDEAVMTAYRAIQISGS